MKFSEAAASFLQLLSKYVYIRRVMRFLRATATAAGALEIERGQRVHFILQIVAVGGRRRQLDVAQDERMHPYFALRDGRSDPIYFTRAENVKIYIHCYAFLRESTFDSANAFQEVGIFIRTE